jgi:hypothetical protein
LAAVAAWIGTASIESGAVKIPNSSSAAVNLKAVCRLKRDRLEL